MTTLTPGGQKLADALVAADILAEYEDKYEPQMMVNAAALNTAATTLALDAPGGDDEHRLSLSGAPMPPEGIDGCAACGVPFKEGDMVIHDITEGTMHRACVGDDRGSFVDIETEEPIGPNGPLPAGTPWHLDPVPTGGGDGSLREALKEASVQLCALIPDPRRPDFSAACPNPADAECLSLALSAIRAALARPDHREKAAAGVGSHGIYIASKTAHADKWRQFRTLGFPIISTWIDEAGKGETACFTDLWRRCVAEAAGADALVVYREPGEVLKGAFVEVGAALAAGKPVFAVGCDEFSFVHHALVTRCENVTDAVNRAVHAALTQPNQPPEVATAGSDDLRAQASAAQHGRAWVAAEYRVAGSPHEHTASDSLAMARFILSGTPPAGRALKPCPEESDPRVCAFPDCSCTPGRLSVLQPPQAAVPSGSVGEEPGAREPLTDHGEAGASIAHRVVQRVCEFDDRTSPEDQPEMMLVTGQELTDLIEEEVSRYWPEPALAQQPAPQAPALLRNEPLDTFGAHITDGAIGTIGDRVIGKDHVVLSKARYDWLMSIASPQAPVADAAGLRDALDLINVHDEADNYELRADGDYTPNDFEKSLLEDFGAGLIAKVAEALAALTPPQAARPGDGVGVHEAFAKLEGDSLDAICEVIGSPRLFNDGKSTMRNWFLGRLRQLWSLPAPVQADAAEGRS